MSTSIWTIDPMHSEISFKVKHLVISTVTGNFSAFEGSMTTEGEDFEGARITFAAQVNSINTGNEHRDNHLKSDDFFNVEQFPTLSFESTTFHKKSEGEYHLEGQLTIRDITLPVEFDVEFGGTAVDPYGNVKAGFELNGKINRKDYNLKWTASTEAGGLVVSDEVRLHVNVQMAKQVATEQA